MKFNLLQPGRYYHIFNCTKNGDPLFYDEEDYHYFLKLYRTHIVPIAETYAYCLLQDHLHLLLRIREDAEGSLYKPFALLFNAYVKCYNKRHHREGRLMQFKLKRIEIRSQTSIEEMVRFISQNARRHGLTDDLARYRFSSYRATIAGAGSIIHSAWIAEHFGAGDQLVNLLNTPVDERRVRRYLIER